MKRSKYSFHDFSAKHTPSATLNTSCKPWLLYKLGWILEIGVSMDSECGKTRTCINILLTPILQMHVILHIIFDVKHLHTWITTIMVIQNE